MGTETTMTEAQLKALVQQTAWATGGFLVVVVAWLILMSVAPDGRRYWAVLRDAVKDFLSSRARYVAPVGGAEAALAARTGAAGEEGRAPHQDAGAAGAPGAVRGAAPAIPAGSLLLSADEQRAVAGMVRHKVAVPAAKKLDTIQAGWPEIKARSGDPQSKYARASAIYDAIFAPPPPAATPIAGREVPAGVEFVGKP